VKVKRDVPLRYSPYPYVPSKDKERQFVGVKHIFKNLKLNMPFVEALERMPTYAKSRKF